MAQPNVSHWTHQGNPIYQHLTRNRRWPSVPIVVAVFVIIAVAPTIALSIWLADVLRQNTVVPADLPIIMTLACLAIALISPWITAAMSAISAAAPASDESYTLLKLTGISPARMVIGHVWASIFRLRLLWAICYGLLPPLSVASLGAAISIDQTFSDGMLTSSALLDRNITSAFIVFVVGLVLGTTINWVALCAGIWAGLRFRKLGQAVATTLGIVVIEFIAVGFIQWVLSYILYISTPLYWILWIIVLSALTYIATKTFLSMAEQSL